MHARYGTSYIVSTEANNQIAVTTIYLIKIKYSFLFFSMFYE